MLVHTRGSGGRRTENQWLLIKERDEEARAGRAGPVGRRRPQRLDRPHAWRRSPPARSRAGGATRAGGTDAGARGRDADDRAERRVPATVPLTLATLVDEPPDGDDWLHEIKYDGYRIAARVDDGGVRLFSRNGLDWTERFPAVAEALAAPAGLRRRGWTARRWCSTSAA